MIQRIILSTGGTGGHVFPALSLADELKERGYAVDLITDQRGASYKDSKAFDRTYIIQLPKGQGVIGKLRQILSIVWQTIRCGGRFLRQRPDMVIGFGGYTSAPVILAALVLRIPFIVHEQNAVLGRVNRLMGAFAQKIALGMPVTRHADPDRSVFVGNPVRRSILEAQLPKQVPDKLRLFIFGGSQGADLFARIVPAAVALLPEALQQRLTIVHQAREEILPQTRQAYEKTKVKIEALAPFYADMPNQLSQADLIVCRAGAMTVTEVSVMGRAAIFVPLKIAMDNHQFWNVKPMVEAGAAEVILETDFTPNMLANKLQQLIENEPLRHALAENIYQFSHRNSAQKLADLIETSLKKY